MQRLKQSIFSVCLLALMGAVFINVRAEAAYYFAYAMQTDAQTVEIHRVNPQTPEQVIAPLPVNVPDMPGQVTLDRMLVSPDGHWTMLIFDERALFLLVDMTTGQQRPVFQIEGYIERDPFTPPTDAEWSPDSRYFAFAANYPTETYTIAALAIYEVTTGATRFPFGDSASCCYPMEITWSPDSTKIAVMTPGNCAASSCSGRIDLVTLENETFHNETAFVDVFVEFCDGVFSPDNRYLVFKSACYYGSIAMPGDMHLWDTTCNPERGYVDRRLTDTYARLKDYRIYWDISYSPFWLDETHLLLGARTYAMNNDSTSIEATYQDETRLYDVAANTSTLIFDGMLGEPVRNPVSGAIAYYRSPEPTGFGYSESSPYDPINNVPLIPPGTIEIATWDGAQLQPEYISSPVDAPRDLAWSPDGAWLSYRVYSSEILSIEFIDMADDSVKAAPLPAGNNADFPVLRVGGWVVGSG